MNIKLTPHLGKNVATKRLIDLGQDRIFVDDELYGYVGRKADAPIMLIYSAVPETIVQAIREAVTNKYGGTASQVAAPPVMPEDVDEDADDE
jgi:hypothetical protein